MTRKSHRYIDDDTDDENDHKRLVSSHSASTCESEHNAGDITINVPFRGDENDYKRLESRDSGDSRESGEVSEHHIGPFTIIRSLDDRKHSMFFSDLVISQGEYHHGKPGELFNDFGSQEEIHRKTSKKAKFGVALVIIMLLVMLVVVVFCLLSSPPDHSARGTGLKAITNHNHNNTSTT